MPIASLKTNYALNLQKCDFNIVRIEDLFKQEDVDIILKDHKVNFYSLFFITHNTGKHSIDYSDYPYSRGTVLAIRKDQIQRFYINKEVKGYLIFFREEFLNSYLTEIEVSKTIQMFNEMLLSPLTQLNKKVFFDILILLKYVEDELLKISDNYSDKIIRSLLHVLITMIHRFKSEGYNKEQINKYLKEFIKFQNLLEKEYSNTKKVFDYANKLGYSTKKLNTIVQLIVNKPAKEFINDTIIIKIKRQLLYTNLSIKEVSYKLGFKDATNLFKYFKKHTGYTPNEFRKNF